MSLVLSRAHRDRRSTRRTTECSVRASELVESIKVVSHEAPVGNHAGIEDISRFCFSLEIGIFFAQAVFYESLYFPRAVAPDNPTWHLVTVDPASRSCLARSQHLVTRVQFRSTITHRLQPKVRARFGGLQLTLCPSQIQREETCPSRQVGGADGCIRSVVRRHCCCELSSVSQVVL